MILDTSKIKKIDDFLEIAEQLLDARIQDKPLITTQAWGSSMDPAVLSGDRIVIDPTQIHSLKVGDIVAFSKDVLLVCHRIKEVREQAGRRSFIMIGDAFKSPDPGEVALEEVAGKVVWLIRDGERWDPYRGVWMNGSQSFSGKARRAVRKIAWHTYFLLKRFGRRSFEFLGLYTPVKQLFFKTVRHRLGWLFALSRKRTPHPSYRFVDFPMATIWDQDKEFFEPLDAIGGFRVSASLGGRKIGRCQVCKYVFPDTSRNFWAVTDFWTHELFRETGLEAELIRGCHVFLEPLRIRDLYFIMPADSQEGPALLDRWGAQFTGARDGGKRFLLPRDLPDRWGTF